MPQLSPLDDVLTYRKYADEAYTRKRQLEEALQKRKSLPLGGKSAAIGEGYPFNRDGSGWNPKAASAAYDHTTNNMEQRIEDEEESVRQNNAKARSASRAAVLAEDAAAKAGQRAKKR